MLSAAMPMLCLTFATRATNIELFASKFRDAPRWKKPLRFVTREVEGHNNIVLDCRADTTAAPEATGTSDVDRALMQLPPGEYSLSAKRPGLSHRKSNTKKTRYDCVSCR